MKSVFVTPEVFDWSSELSSWGSFPRQKQRRDYEILGHASRLLEGDDSADRRGDCVNALNRVIDKRVRLLNDHYRIDEILGSKKSIDNLERIGAARPYMLLQINHIRNLFEHRDRKPPPRKRLKFFVELTWYFLKATDIPAYVPRTEIQLNREGMLDQGEDYLIVSYSRKSRASFPWNIKISLLPGRFSFTPIDGWPEFEFPGKELRMLPEYQNKLWAYGGRLASKGYEHRILAKFLEA